MSGLLYYSFTEHLYKHGSIKVDLSTSKKDIITIHEKHLFFILVPTKEFSTPELAEIERFSPVYRKIYIHEDLWFTKRDIMVSRIHQVLGLNQKIAARKCEVKSIAKLDSEIFLNLNHLLGSCTAAYKIGLFYNNELIAVGSFSKSRVMTDGKVYYRSFEMLRFAVKMGYSVTGGLGKILQHFIHEKNVVHLMTYIDNEWGFGEAFLQMGFKAISSTEPQTYWIDSSTNKRFKSMEDLSTLTGLIEKRNLGSTKLVLDLRPNDN